ncbi:hypothetical protein [Rathayibacter sp. Leaf296]|uniref:hypothetical protein n=1 Tax=Rathayibacter sp. Leaf296 TaxID=1736327 RepID=UPI0007033C47|nr:hypothetical protein [Rathayibacter sp. Leaf296]KQQ07556.1 hypothetical protein ASF46_18125 [Rathayibacter sp. Leaf296]
MSGEVLLDTENVFHGVSAQQRPETDERTVQSVLFGDGGTGERELCELRAMLRAVDLVLGWFEWHSGAEVAAVDSYGKRWDPAVDLLLRSLASGEEGLARIEVSRTWAPAIHPDALLVLFTRRGVRIIHHVVGNERHAAENELVDELRRRLDGGSPSAAYLLGGEDHDALLPADHLQARHPEVELWLLLPRSSRVWRRAHRLGALPHLAADRFVTVGELLRSFDEGDAAVETRLAEEHRHRSSVLSRARSSLARRRVALLTQEQEGALASLSGVHAAGLQRQRQGSDAWVDAIGSAWLVAAADAFLPTVAGPAELARLRSSGIGGERAAYLVRQCGILRLREERPDIGPSALGTFLTSLSSVMSTTSTLSALAAVSLR